MASNLSPEAKAENDKLYRELNKSYTQKTQALAEQRQKVEFVDQFMQMYQRDPDSALGELMKTLGYQPKAAPAAQARPDAPGDANWQPKTWTEVLEKASEMAASKMRGEIQPVMEKYEELSTQTIEQKLNEIDPQWRLYEDKMRENMARYPDMVNNLADLYRISVPPEVQEKLAYNAAMRKLDGERQAGRVSGSASVPRAVDSGADIKTFDDAVRLAQEKLKSGG
jgi:hypothetical protein